MAQFGVGTRWIVYREVSGECAGERETLFLADGGVWTESAGGALRLPGEEARALARSGRRLGLGTSARPAPEVER